MVHNGLGGGKGCGGISPDIVIADIRMPELDGLSLLRRIKEAKRDINFLIVSGYRNFEYVRDALQNEAEDYLLKPIRRAELNEALKKIIEKRNRKQEISRNVSSLRQGGFVGNCWNIRQKRIIRFPMKKSTKNFIVPSVVEL